MGHDFLKLFLFTVASAGFLNPVHDTLVCRAHSCCFCQPPKVLRRLERVASYVEPQIHLDPQELKRWLAVPHPHPYHPAVLHVGANAISDDEARFYQDLAAELGGLPLRLIFVEPFVEVTDALRRRMYRLLGPNSSVEVEVFNIAMCPSQVEEEAVMLHAISQELPPGTSEHLRAFVARASQLSSLSPHQFQKSLRQFVRDASDLYQFPGGVKTLTSLLNRQSVLIPVECLNAAQLLKKLQLPSSALKLLIVDVEGLDTALVNDFLALPGFNPHMVQWEYEHTGAYPSTRAYRNATYLVVNQLAAQGYDIMAIIGDMIAVQAT